MLSTALLTAALFLPTDANACGGFFCSNEFPIDQSAEQIVFGIDEENGEVEVHVGITYEGASDDFAWIVPVPAQPDLFVSSDALFTAVSELTRPRFLLEYQYSGMCDWGWRQDDFALAAGDMDGGNPPTSEDDGVTVISEEQVGPYQTVVLQAESSGQLLTWLNTAGYDLPADLDPVLTPYIADGQYFVALKLSAGKETGDLAPLGMRYPGTAASVPIQLTSIAAVPDMRLEVYVFGQARAVPQSYLHVTINDAAISWFDGGQNYNEVISMAADEAGGHAFATDYAGSTADLQGTLWRDQEAQVDYMRTLDDPFEWMWSLLGLGLPPSAAMLDVLQEVIPMPDGTGVDPRNFYDCLECYAQHVDTENFDGAAATALLDEKIIAGLREAERLFAAYPHVSRMTSSLDAIEMTVDPVFVYNRDLPQTMSNVHRATVEYECSLAQSPEAASRRLVLSDGRAIRLPTERWMSTRDVTEIEVIGDLAFPAAIMIERYGAVGTGEVLFDYRDEAAREARRFRPGACGGCDTGTAPGGGVAGLLALALLARRRRS